MNIYLTYGARQDQVIALRLQVLASSDEIYVPPAFTRGPNKLDMTSLRLLEACDLVLAIVRSVPSSGALEAELRQAGAWNKRIVVIQPRQAGAAMKSALDARVIEYDIGDPSAAAEQLTSMQRDWPELKPLAPMLLVALGLVGLEQSELAHQD